MKSRSGLKNKKFVFFNHLSATEEIISFLGTTIKCTNDSYLSCLESNLKNKTLNYEESEKTNVWNLNLDKKRQFNFFPKNDCLRHKFFLDAAMRCANDTSSKCSDSDLKNVSLMYEKNEKLTLELSIWVRK